jgi:hypothetical protein
MTKESTENIIFPILENSHRNTKCMFHATFFFKTHNRHTDKKMDARRAVGWKHHNHQIYLRRKITTKTLRHVVCNMYGSILESTKTLGYVVCNMYGSDIPAATFNKYFMQHFANHDDTLKHRFCNICQSTMKHCSADIATRRRILQHLKTTSATFVNNIYNIRKQHLQYRESNIKVGRINIRNIENILIYFWNICTKQLQHPHETSETREIHACNMLQNLPTACRILTPIVPLLVRLCSGVVPWVVARGGCTLDPQVVRARRPCVAQPPPLWRSSGAIHPDPTTYAPPAADHGCGWELPAMATTWSSFSNLSEQWIGVGDGTSSSTHDTPPSAAAQHARLGRGAATGSTSTQARSGVRKRSG